MSVINIILGINGLRKEHTKSSKYIIHYIISIVIGSIVLIYGILIFLAFGGIFAFINFAP